MRIYSLDNILYLVVKYFHRDQQRDNEIKFLRILGKNIDTSFHPF